MKNINKTDIKILIIVIECATIWWLLFGGGALNSPSLGFQFMLWMMGQ